MWNIYFDETYDLIYLFIANLTIISGEEVGLPFNVNLTDEEKDNQKLMNAISIFKECEV